MSELKALYWNVTDQECIISDNPELVPGIDGKIGALKRTSAAKVSERLRREAVKYFGTRPNRPTLEISFLKERDYKRWAGLVFEMEESRSETDPVDITKVFKIRS